MLTKTEKYSVIGLLFSVFLLQSCSVAKQIEKDFSDKNHTYFTGLMVYNPDSNKTLISYNSDKYFTPASTVKLFTLYTSLHYLPDSIATISYFETSDTLFIKPLADPSFLHDSLPNKTYNFLSYQSKPIAIIPDTFSDFIYGDGWQWDDYQYYYMPEKSLFPFYGNTALISGNKIMPNHFQKMLYETEKEDFHRDFYRNIFYYNADNVDVNRKVPFKTSLALSVELLSDTLHKEVSISTFEHTFEMHPYISTPVKPLYKRLMNESENFMAEQLFLQVAKKVTGNYNVSNAIQVAMDSLFYDIPQKPRWVDASGLSRYNIFTPHSMVYLLDKMEKEYGKEIIQLMPINGKNGSLQKWYPFDTTYLYAKTGSVSNNHSLSGYMITKKGTFLIFSYMNNNFIEKSSEIREKMNGVLQKIYNTY